MKTSSGGAASKIVSNDLSPLALLTADGDLTGECPMSLTDVVAALRLMLLSRAIDERLIKLQRMGRIALYAPVYGQEAAVIGPAMALDPSRDWIVPASREQPAMLRHGLPLLNLFARYMGRLNDAAIPPGVKLLPRQEAIGAQLPQAVGLAWALKLQKLQSCVMVYFGDGASSEGDFHEASNLAGVIRVPLVFVLINNQYAISTPVHKQTATKNLAARAAGYGFPGIVVDGNDLLAVYSASAAAVTRALAGKGPSMIECKTYRIGFHNTSDNPREYRDDAEVANAIRFDPIERVRRFATRAGLWSAEQEVEVMVEIRRDIDQVQHAVQALPRPNAEAIFEHVYAAPTERLMKQRAEALSIVTGDTANSR